MAQHEAVNGLEEEVPKGKASKADVKRQPTEMDGNGHPAPANGHLELSSGLTNGHAGPENGHAGLTNGHAGSGAVSKLPRRPLQVWFSATCCAWLGHEGHDKASVTRSRRLLGCYH